MKQFLQSTDKYKNGSGMTESNGNNDVKMRIKRGFEIR